MTIIVAKDGVMAADSAVWSGGSVVAAHQRKIARLANGSLVGVAGAPGFGQWFVTWLDRNRDKPVAEWSHDGVPVIDPDIGFAAIWYRADGSRLRFNGSTLPFVESGPYSVCGGDAVPLAVGALEGGASPRDAVEIAIRCGDAAGGEIQVEYLARIPA